MLALQTPDWRQFAAAVRVLLTLAAAREELLLLVVAGGVLRPLAERVAAAPAGADQSGLEIALQLLALLCFGHGAGGFRLSAAAARAHQARLVHYGGLVRRSRCC